jgi:hypothetical protein
MANVVRLPYLGPKGKLKVIVACEYSGRVRDAFTARGHEAWSCDLLPTESPGLHIQGDIWDVLKGIYEGRLKYDLVIAHPPCTRLAVSGALHFHKYEAEQEAALKLVEYMLGLPVAHLAIENPISIISSRLRKPSQIIQPWQFGHGETKATCLWLKGLPNLLPTNIVDGRESKVHNMSPGPNRGKLRSLTYAGIATAMAAQWSEDVSNG